MTTSFRFMAKEWRTRPKRSHLPSPAPTTYPSTTQHPGTHSHQITITTQKTLCTINHPRPPDLTQSLPRSLNQSCPQPQRFMNVPRHRPPRHPTLTLSHQRLRMVHRPAHRPCGRFRATRHSPPFVSGGPQTLAGPGQGRCLRQTRSTRQPRQKRTGHGRAHQSAGRRCRRPASTQQPRDWPHSGGRAKHRHRYRRHSAAPAHLSRRSTPARLHRQRASHHASAKPHRMCSQSTQPSLHLDCLAGSALRCRSRPTQQTRPRSTGARANSASSTTMPAGATALVRS